MALSKLLLFVSSVSKHSADCINFINKAANGQISQILQIVRLDTSEARESAANGQHFQITTVPTLVVCYEDGNTQIFLGSHKIVEWFKVLLKPPNVHPQNPRPREDPQMHHRGQSSNIYDVDPSLTYQSPPDPIGIGPLPIPRGIPRKMPSDATSYRAPIIDEGEDMYYEDEASVRRPSRPTKHVEAKPRRAPPPVVEEIDSPEEIEEEIEIIEEEPPRKPKKSGKSKRSGRKEASAKLNQAASTPSNKTKQTAKMKNIYAKAKQMQQEMVDSLGYKEEDLPRY